jgi:CDP-diacylglycerol pyrophosphatase
LPLRTWWLSTSNPQRAVRIALLVVAVLLAGAAAAVVIFSVRKHQRSVLWHVVQLCVADQIQNGRPRPCTYVSLEAGIRGGYAVLEDPLSPSQVLVLPTRRISGIESPELLSADAPNYLEAAWRSRRFVFQRLRRKLARDAIGFAVNSAPDRSQDQLHIHVDCLQPSVRRQIDSHVDAIGTTWKKLGFSLAGRHYSARRIERPTLRGINPFRLLADWVTSNGGAMWRETLVLVAVTFGGHHDGFVLLADFADPAIGNPGHGEALLDHSCALAK